MDYFLAQGQKYEFYPNLCRSNLSYMIILVWLTSSYEQILISLHIENTLNCKYHNIRCLSTCSITQDKNYLPISILLLKL